MAWHSIHIGHHKTSYPYVRYERSTSGIATNGAIGRYEASAPGIARSGACYERNKMPESEQLSPSLSVSTEAVRPTL